MQSPYWTEHKENLDNYMKTCDLTEKEKEETVLKIPINKTFVEEKLEENSAIGQIFRNTYNRKNCPLESAKDNINPSHYKGKIECIDAIESALSREEFIGFLRGNAIKYNWRVRHKGGAEDIKKALWYQKRLITLLENKDNKND